MPPLPATMTFHHVLLRGCYTAVTPLLHDFGSRCPRRASASLWPSDASGGSTRTSVTCRSGCGWGGMIRSIPAALRSTVTSAAAAIRIDRAAAPRRVRTPPARTPPARTHTGRTHTGRVLATDTALAAVARIRVGQVRWIQVDRMLRRLSHWAHRVRPHSSSGGRWEGAEW